MTWSRPTVLPASAPSGVIAAGVHLFPVRIYYEDTDAGGIVYHANYLRFAERARTEMMRLLGAEHSAIRSEEGVIWAVRALSVDYRQPARLDDHLMVETRVTAMGGASLRLVQTILRHGASPAFPDAAAKPPELAHIELRLACIDGAGRPARLPARVRDALAALAATGGT